MHTSVHSTRIVDALLWLVICLRTSESGGRYVLPFAFNFCLGSTLWILQRTRSGLIHCPYSGPSTVLLRMCRLERERERVQLLQFLLSVLSAASLDTALADSGVRGVRLEKSVGHANDVPLHMLVCSWRWKLVRLDVCNSVEHMTTVLYISPSWGLL
jgi:hypothetical protein